VLEEEDEGGGGTVGTGGGAEEGGLEFCVQVSRWREYKGPGNRGSEMGGPAAESALYGIQRIINALLSDILETNKEFLDPVMEDLCEKGACVAKGPVNW